MDIVSLQHEFGICGGTAGGHILATSDSSQIHRNILVKEKGQQCFRLFVSSRKTTKTRNSCFLAEVLGAMEPDVESKSVSDFRETKVA